MKALHDISNLIAHGLGRVGLCFSALGTQGQDKYGMRMENLWLPCSQKRGAALTLVIVHTVGVLRGLLLRSETTTVNAAVCKAV